MAKYVVLYRFTEQGAKSIRETVGRARETRQKTRRGTSGACGPRAHTTSSPSWKRSEQAEWGHGEHCLG
jgi:hypothetical protein